MGTSYQDIDVRLAQVEDKIDFVMRSFNVNKQYAHPLNPDQILVETTNLLKVYQELKNGSMIVEEPANGVVITE